MIKAIKDFFVWLWKEQDKLCPHCGYYCTNSSAFCRPPSTEDVN